MRVSPASVCSSSLHTSRRGLKIEKEAGRGGGRGGGGRGEVQKETRKGEVQRKRERLRRWVKEMGDGGRGGGEERRGKKREN